MEGPDSEIVVVLVSGEATTVCGRLGADDRVDLTLVNQLARLQLAARRLGCSIVLRGVGVRLAELIDFAGLTDVLPSVSEPGREVGGKPEGGEQVGVEEGMEPSDPVA
ncbi:MAG TPA: hypothetical protein VHU85_00725 [Acidimicrobiales bacterium]|nr:hypothetical protein [Acidimicrobiales bacterium]